MGNIIPDSAKDNLHLQLHQKNTRILTLTKGNYDQRDADLIAEFLKENSTLTKLNLARNKFADRGTIILMLSLQKNSILKDLNFSNNIIGNTGAEAIANILKINSALTHLNLSNNIIADEGASAIGVALKKNSVLKSLNLLGNQVGDLGMQTLADGLEINSSLTRLSLYENKITDYGFNMIAIALKLPDLGDIVYRRIITKSNEEDAKVGDWVYAEEALKVGTEVLAQWKSGDDSKKYAGRIQNINEDGYSILFDDGDIRFPCPLDEFETVNNRSYAKIEHINEDKTYQIRFENGKIQTFSKKKKKKWKRI